MDKGSNPTPRAYLGGSSKNIIRFDTRYLSLDKKTREGDDEWNLTLNIQKPKQFITQDDEENDLVKKIESITKSLRKQYFKKSLVTLTKI